MTLVTLRKPAAIEPRALILLFPVIALMHEFEEWNILGWHRAVNTGVPDVTDLHVRTALGIVVLANFVWAGASLIPRSKQWSSNLILPLVAIGVMNGIQHLIWTIQFGRYAPGVVFGFLGFTPIAVCFAYRVLRERLVPRWFVIALGSVVLAAIVLTLLRGDEIDPMVKSAMLFARGLWEG